MEHNSHKYYNKLSDSNSGYIEIQLPVIQQSDKAICFDDDNSFLGNMQKKVWIPKSQVEIIDLGKDAGIRYFVKKWLYSKFQ